MTYAEQLNAILRFTIYLALILVIAGRSSTFLFLPIGTALVTYLLYSSELHSDVPDSRRVEGFGSASLTMTPKSTKVKEKCQEPTKENPFMNVLMNEYVDRPKRRKACDIQNSRISATAENYFTKANNGLVRESDDIYHRKASSRQFVTNPSTSIPNDQTAFAKWLYHSPPECKAKNRSKCTYRI